MADIEATIDTKRFERAMKQAPLALFTNLRKRVKNHHKRTMARFKKERFQGRGVQNRTGALRDSFHVAQLGAHLDDLEVRSFSAGNKYARIQEEGGEIRPKRAKFLTIPLDAAKTARGVARKPPREWNDTFFLRTDDGDLLLMHDVAPKPEPLFALVKRVEIPGNLGFVKTYRGREKALLREIDQAAADALQGVAS